MDWTCPIPQSGWAGLTTSSPGSKKVFMTCIAADLLIYLVANLHQSRRWEDIATSKIWKASHNDNFFGLECFGQNFLDICLELFAGVRTVDYTKDAGSVIAQVSNLSQNCQYSCKVVVNILVPLFASLDAVEFWSQSKSRRGRSACLSAPGRCPLPSTVSHPRCRATWQTVPCS